MAEVDARWTRLLTLDPAVDDPDVDDEAAVLVAQLQAEAEESVLALALAALSADEPWHRQAAAWVVGQFGYPRGRPFGSRVAPELLRAARAERDDEVRSDVVPLWASRRTRRGSTRCCRSRTTPRPRCVWPSHCPCRACRTANR
ncbi:HEAT repeat domain-containing protein [Cellulomonas sp. S1-8]|uniref:HEAT repeat domain-containing protein n=1 Tax=Cellulomonas sp. S1-8 TaxID=2904790 RepID=UPI003A10106D